MGMQFEYELKSIIACGAAYNQKNYPGSGFLNFYLESDRTFSIFIDCGEVW